MYKEKQNSMAKCKYSVLFQLNNNRTRDRTKLRQKGQNVEGW